MHSVLYNDAVGALELYIIYLGERLGHHGSRASCGEVKAGPKSAHSSPDYYQRRLMQEFSAGTIIVVIPVRRLDVRASKNGSCRDYDQPPRDTENRRERLSGSRGGTNRAQQLTHFLDAMKRYGA
jgi:hypothetical protein